MNKQNLFTLICVALLALIAGFTTYHLFKNVQVEPQKSAFVFTQQKATDWWAGTNNYPKQDMAGQYQAETDTLPEVAMTVAQGTPEVPKNCFVNYFYWQESIDSAQALEAMKAKTIEGGGLTLTDSGTHEFTMNDVPFTLHQYEIGGEENGNIASGVEFGYVPLGDGYVEMRGYCETVALLESTLPVFDAVTFKR